MDSGDARALVADAGRILSHLGLADYLGHSSARVEGTNAFVIKPKHSPTVRDMGSVGAEELLVMGADGRTLEGSERPPAEFHIHSEIYRLRPDVGGIVHTHQRASTLLGVLELPPLPMLHLHVMFVDQAIPIWGFPTIVNTRERGVAMAQALGGGRFLHLQGHGIVSVGPDLRVATVGAILLEELADATLRVRSAGGEAHLITEEEVDDLVRNAAPVDGRWEYYRSISGC